MEGYEVRLNIWYKPAEFRISVKIDTKTALDIDAELRKLEGHLTETTDVKIWLTGGHSIDNKDAVNREKAHEQKLNHPEP